MQKNIAAKQSGTHIHNIQSNCFIFFFICSIHMLKFDIVFAFLLELCVCVRCCQHTVELPSTFGTWIFILLASVFTLSLAQTQQTYQTQHRIYPKCSETTKYNLMWQIKKSWTFFSSVYHTTTIAGTNGNLGKNLTGCNKMYFVKDRRFISSFSHVSIQISLEML